MALRVGHHPKDGRGIEGDRALDLETFAHGRHSDIVDRHGFRGRKYGRRTEKKCDVAHSRGVRPDTDQGTRRAQDPLSASNREAPTKRGTMNDFASTGTITAPNPLSTPSSTTGRTDAAPRRLLGRVARRLGALTTLAAIGATLVTFAGSAAPASAATAGDAVAYESVACNARLHTVTLNYTSAGHSPGAYNLTGDGIQELVDNRPLPVWVQVTYYAYGGWHTMPWGTLPYGNATKVLPVTGVSYWYFNFAFQTPGGGFDYRSEYAGGRMSAYGWYSSGNYNSLTSCNS